MKKIAYRPLFHFALTTLMGILFLPLPALSTSKGAGTSGGTFLKIDVGARPAAMGGAFVGLADDVNALHYNPAGLHQLRQVAISTMHAEWFLDINYEFLGLAMPIGARNTLGSSIILLNSKDTKRGALGTVLETFKIQDIAFTIGDAFQINQSFTAGLTAKYISQTIFHTTANAFSVDVGLKYFSPIPGFELGISMQNLGTHLKFEREGDPLLHIFRFGGAYRFLDRRFVVTGDLIKPRGLSVEGAVGAEYNYHDLVFLRGGYRLGQNLPGADALSVGLGLQFRNLTVDYAFAPFGDLGTTHRFSGGVKFGRVAERRERVKKIHPPAKRIIHKRKKPAVSPPEIRKAPARGRVKIAMLDFTGEISELDDFNDRLFERMTKNRALDVPDRESVTEKIIAAESMELDKLPSMLNVKQVMFGSLSKDGDLFEAEVSIISGSGDIDMRLYQFPQVSVLVDHIMEDILKNQ